MRTQITVLQRLDGTTAFGIEVNGMPQTNMFGELTEYDSEDAALWEAERIDRMLAKMESIH